MIRRPSKPPKVRLDDRHLDEVAAMFHALDVSINPFTDDVTIIYRIENPSIPGVRPVVQSGERDLTEDEKRAVRDSYEAKQGAAGNFPKSD